MLTILFVRGNYEDIERVHRGSPARFARLCRYNDEDGAVTWTSKDNSLHCELRSFEFDVTNIGEFRRLLFTLNDEVGGAGIRTGGCEFFVIGEPNSVRGGGGGGNVGASKGFDMTKLGPGGEPEMPFVNKCECSLQLCMWCRTVNYKTLPKSL